MQSLDRRAALAWLIAAGPGLLLVAQLALGDGVWPLPVLHAFGGWTWIAALGSLAVVAALRCAGPGALAGVVLAVAAGRTVPGVLGGPVQGEPDLRVLTANLWAGAVDREATVAALLALDADVLVLQEVDAGWGARLDALPGYTAVGEVRPGAFGIRVLSRLPVARSEVWALGGRVPAVDLDVRVGGHTVRVLGVHAVPPHHPSLAPLWHAQLGELATRARTSAGPTVMAGDFNATRYTPSLGTVLGAGLRDAAADVGRAAERTWPVGRFGPWTLLRLDHVLVSEDVQVLDVRTGPRGSSDHLPVVADLRVGRP